MIAVYGYRGEPSKATKGLGQFFIPKGIAVDDQGVVYVADWGNSRVQELARRGPIGEIGSSGVGAGEIRGPAGVAVDRKGFIYVVDDWLNRVLKFSPAGALVWVAGGPGSQPGHFEGPGGGIAVDSQGNVYVVDDQGDRVEVFSSDGRFLATWGHGGSAATSLRSPGGITVDAQDHIWITHNVSLSEYTRDGQLLRTITYNGTSWLAGGVAVASDGTLYATDITHYRILVFNPDGSLKAIWN